MRAGRQRRLEAMVAPCQQRRLASPAVESRRCRGTLGELLDSGAADLEPVSDQPGIEVLINNPLTDPGDIVLVKLHFTWLLVGEIPPTNSLADTTDNKMLRLHF